VGTPADAVFAGSAFPPFPCAISTSKGAPLSLYLFVFLEGKMEGNGDVPEGEVSKKALIKKGGSYPR
jgi:hypothetical protein